MFKLTKGFVARLGVTAAVCALLSPTMANAVDVNAAIAAANGPACTSSRPFYWEIGTSQYAPGDPNYGDHGSGNIVVSGQVGVRLYARGTRYNLASASKWVFGAYVMQRYNGPPPQTIEDGLQMQTGYTQFDEIACLLTATVTGCFNASVNHVLDPNAVGTFYYSGGNDEYIASTASLLGLGSDTPAQLTAEYKSKLGSDVTLDFQYPSLHSGMEGSAEEYAVFLQKMMRSPTNGGYVMRDYLGYHPVATQPCPPNETGCSPATNVAWHYGLNYWIEDNEVTGTFSDGTVIAPGDGAFSSPGAYGFYPWISADKAYYGILARRSLIGTAYERSIGCGQAIRYAFEGYTPPQ